MPNHCINEVIFREVDQKHQEAILAATCADGKVSFDVLVPAPLNVWQGNTGSAEEKVFGKLNWYNWNTENWGTKWNAYGHEPVEQTADTLTLRFQTAWGPPYPWLAAVLNHLALPFEHNWVSEGGAPARSGAFKMNGQFGGRDWKEVPAESDLSRHLEVLLWGEELAEEGVL